MLLLPTYLPNDYDSLIFGEKENIFRCFGDRERKRRTKRLDSKRRRYTDSLKVGPVGHRQEVESLLHEAGGYGPERFGKKNGETFLGVTKVVSVTGGAQKIFVNHLCGGNREPSLSTLATQVARYGGGWAIEYPITILMGHSWMDPLDPIS